MGFLKAFASAASGSFADQWKDFYGPKQNVSPTAAVFQAVPYGQNAGRGENYKGSQNIITNGSKIVVPEGTALITLQDGQITGLIAEPGGYEYKSDDINSQSLFAGGFLSATIVQSFERFKFGGMPGSEQLAFYINLKEIAGNKFGTQKPIYWQDSYLQLKAGGSATGTYSLNIIDPVLFVKNFVPLQFLQAGAPEFDFSDMDNPAGQQLFMEFLTCLSNATSIASKNALAENADTLDYIQEHQIEFSSTMNETAETAYHWNTNRGLSITSISILMDYDEKTQELLDEIRKQDAEIRRATRLGSAYSQNMSGMMASASAQAMQNASANENGAMMGFMGLNMAQQNGANLMGAVNNMQPQQPMNNTMDQTQATMQQPQSAPTSNVASGTDPYEELKKAKDLLDAGIITAEDFEAKKKVLLGI